MFDDYCHHPSISYTVSKSNYKASKVTFCFEYTHSSTHTDDERESRSNMVNVWYNLTLFNCL